ncbi:nucleotidyltransferase family protein [Streptomyces sp. NPDC051563]|uniref:nucleotidyltransferase family protein n=1 Tax=unclassified Streptomyces TaxID=2593676 RepID=UPI00379764C2
MSTADPDVTPDLTPATEAATLPGHAQLLLALARPELTAERLAEVRDLAARPDLDWGAFVDAAARHKLLPLVGRHVQRHRLDRKTPGSFPYAWVFTSAYLGNRQRNHALADEFAQIFRAFGDRGIPYAVRKGFPLAEGEYGDPALRRMTDLDLLLDRADAARAREALEHLGYLQGTLAADGDRIEPYSRETQMFWRINLSQQLPYRKPGGRLEVHEFDVDLTHDIFQKKSGRSAPAAELLARAVPRVVCGVDSWVQEPQDRLLDLCVHLHKEATSLFFIEESIDLQLSKFLDVALVVTPMTQDDWILFLARVAQYDAGEIVYYTLHFVDLLHPDAVPAAVLDRLRPENLDYLDEFGTLDGQRARWSLGFLARLFHTGRREESGHSTIMLGTGTAS